MTEHISTRESYPGGPESPKLENLDLIKDKIGYGFSTKDGNMSFAYGSNSEFGRMRVVSDRKKFVESLGLDLNDLVVMRPVHGDSIVRVTSNMKGMGVFDSESAVQNTDALITTEKNLGLVLNPADCAPIIITNKMADFIAMVHTGRDGTEKQIAVKVLDKLDEMGFKDRSKFIVGIGPARFCYDQTFIRTNNPQDWEYFLTPNDFTATLRIELEKDLSKPQYLIQSSNPQDYLKVNFVGLNIYQMVGAGVRPENIDLVDFCTYCKAKNG